MRVPTPGSPTSAAAASLILPGLGEWLVGRRRRGLLIAAPVLAVGAVVVVVVGAALLTGGQEALLTLGLEPGTLAALVALSIAALVYHDVAILDAWLVARRARPVADPRRRALAVIGLAVVLVIATGLHGSMTTLGVQTEDTMNAIFPEEPGEEWAIPEPSFEPADRAEGDATAEGDDTANAEDAGSPIASGAASSSSTPTGGGAGGASPAVTPAATPETTPRPVPAWARDGRLNLLLVGSDAGPDRWLLRTDTMILLSVDVETARVALFGIPRNLTNVPLPPESASAFPDGLFPRLLNALYVYAWAHPNKFPGGDARGFRAVTGAVQELVGVRLDGFVAVDLRGFVQLVDALGGLWIRVPDRLADDRYPKIDGSGLVRIVINPGCQRLSGEMALAYARSRHQDSDYGRMRRQQLVLLSLRRQLDPIDLLPKAPRLLQIARDHLWTSVRRSDLRSLIKLADRVDPRSTITVRFTPPAYPEHLTQGAIRQIRSVVRHVFDNPSARGSPLALGKACP